jgi:single-strand DNA-binding protein
MAGSLNKVMIIGNLGADPEMRYSPSGAAVTNFRVAATRRWTTPEGQREETEWFTVVTWNKLAETCGQNLSKGRLVYVEGRLRTRSWDGRDGQKHYTTEVIAEEVRFLDSRGTRQGDAGGDFDDDFSPEPPRGQRRPAPPRSTAPAERDLEGDTDPDDIPF